MILGVVTAYSSVPDASYAQDVAEVQRRELKVSYHPYRIDLGLNSPLSFSKKGSLREIHTPSILLESSHKYRQKTTTIATNLRC